MNTSARWAKSMVL